MAGLIDRLIAHNATPSCILDQFYKFNATHKLHSLPNLLSAAGNQEIDAAS
ncbi:hypothetical protein [Paraburkholderia ginsengiterrae]|uniref:hypothetical protein n=1 Tax=Paraburkholderia ginsengiterrae TaxID=1462993 RepID=UPI000A7DD1DF|nr:hypothetical protein [Paraburkholderia ginsengiterrae]